MAGVYRARYVVSKAESHAQWESRASACGVAMARLAAGRGVAGAAGHVAATTGPGTAARSPRGTGSDDGWSAAVAHAAACPACGGRLQRLAAAIRSPAPNEAPCAEWQARLPSYLALGAVGAELDLAFPGLAGHLAACRRCQAVAELLAAVATPAAWSAAPEPERYPRFDTSFLGPGEAPPHAGRRAWFAGLWRRALAPPDVPRRESPLSVGVLGVAVAGLALLVLLAGTWRLFRPREAPLPVAPPGSVATATASATATPTPTGTPAVPGGGRPGGRSGGRAPAGDGTTTLVTPRSTPAPTRAPTERPERARDRPSAVPPPPTDAPYPPPVERPTGGPTEDPYPGGGTIAATEAPYPRPSE